MSAQPVSPAELAQHEIRPQRSLLHTDSGGAILAIVVVCLSFLLYIGRPFTVGSDIGYQALSARQYADHYTPVFESLRLVDTRDLARDAITPLTIWTPSWTALFLIAYKAGLSPGTAGRVLAFLLSLAGALGWVRVVSILQLRRGWRIAGIVFASLYCLRTISITATGAGDLIVYSVAPWLLVGGAALSVPLASGSRKRIVIRTAILCLVLGFVYWLKYTGIFLSIAIVIALVMEQFRTIFRKQLLSSLTLIALYGVVFSAPALALKMYNYSRSGSDFIESSAHYSPPRTPERLWGFISEAAFTSSTVLFSAGPGVERIAGNWPTARAWLVRTPGLLLLFLIFYLMLRRPWSWMRNVTILCAAVPLVIFPLLSFATGARFTFSMGRCCEPYWIFLELVVLKLLAELPPRVADGPGLRIAGYGLALTAAIEVILFLWIPIGVVRESWYIAHSPAWTYQTTDARLWDSDLSKYGTRDIVANVKSLVHSPSDVIVPAVYSNRTFATDTMLEFGGRLLPLNVSPLVKNHSVPGAEYDSGQSFRSSSPLRIVLVAPDPYERPDFRQNTERVMRRFPQVGQWIPGPVDPHGRVWIWVGQIVRNPVEGDQDSGGKPITVPEPKR